MVRSLPTLQKQSATCKKSSDRRIRAAKPSEALQRVLDTAGHYEKKLQGGGSIGASAVLRAISKEIEREGLVCGRVVGEEDAL